MSILYVFYRHGVKMERAYPTVDEALEAAAAATDLGAASYEELIDDDGHVVMNREELGRAIWRRLGESDE